MKLPSLKQLDENMMYEDSDMHLSDYEYCITDVLRKTYEKGSKKVKGRRLLLLVLKKLKTQKPEKYKIKKTRKITTLFYT